jgi:hypothetical protein
MVYSNRFVATVLINGNVQKELANGIVPIPFNSIYSLRFRNKNDRRAVVKFTIDGEDVSGNGYIIPANSAIDIHRHWAKDAQFKFVDLNSAEAVDFGKNGPEGNKGIIQARFHLEKENKVWYPVYYSYNDWNKIYGPGSYYQDPTWNLQSTYTNVQSTYSSVFCEKSELVGSYELQEGCTVEGGQSHQTFQQQYIDLDPTYVELKLQLKGGNLKGGNLKGGNLKGGNLQVVVTYCTVCGAKKARPNDNFCGVCGNRLTSVH